MSDALYSVDVDTGGTMTDALVSGAGRTLAIKVETTPHDLTIAFKACLEQAAEKLGFAGLTPFLDQVSVIRWSSTITSNVLAQRTGPKLGLIVSRGHERDLYAKDPKDLENVIGTLIRPEHIASLAPDASDEDIVKELKRLFDKGIRRVSVSLAGAFPDGAREQHVLEVIGEQFPDHFLGSIPALAGSEMLSSPHDTSRTFFALMNAYVHGSLASSLFRAEDAIKIDHRWKGDILVGHLDGGVARIGKTKAVDTIEAGPLFGTHACAAVAATNRDARVLAIDIGGTTAKASAVLDGKLVMLPRGSLFGIPIETRMPILRSVALGGGSIARVKDGVLTLGPDSAGAAPGPACYGLGGTSATTTDALVVLGILSPSSFLEGRRKLDIEKASAAIAKNVAGPLNVGVLEAARQIERRAAQMVAELGREAMAEAGWSRDSAVTLYAYGGNGPLFATDVARELGIGKVRLFGLGSILSAYGSAMSDLLHVYERALVTRDPKKEIAAAGADLEARARRDLRGEGFDPERAVLEWEVFSAKGSRSGETPGALDLPDATLLRLSARIAMPRLELGEGDPSAAPKKSSRGDVVVYEHGSLRGQSVAGPAAVDGGNFTWNVREGWTLTVDRRGDALATRTP